MLSKIFFSHVASLLLVCTFISAPVEAQESSHADSVQKKITEPIHRVAKATHDNVPPIGKAATDNVDNVKSQLVTATIDPTPATILPSASKILPDLEAAPLAPALAFPSTGPPALPVQPTVTKTKSHPLDEAITVAYRGLKNFRENVRDYSAILVKRERVKDKLLDPEYAQIKVRSPIETETERVPLSIYLKFLKPKACSGREVIWVEGRNQGRLCVHEGSGMLGLKTFNLDPTGWLAMQGNRYPVYEAGLENLMVKLIEKAERDRKAGDCEVVYRKGAKLNGRLCSTIEVTHPVNKAPYDFHKAKVFIDDEYKLPIRYSAHLWPEAGGKPRLLEEYTYLNVKLNLGFGDADFDPGNKAYNYPGR